MLSSIGGFPSGTCSEKEIKTREADDNVCRKINKQVSGTHTHTHNEKRKNTFPRRSPAIRLLRFDVNPRVNMAVGLQDTMASES